MKQAIIYIRISNRDQSNFSIPGQIEYITQFCERKNIKILGQFIDNGQSAKNFDRADWRKLENFVKENYKKIDHLVVVKYDRFSRNVSEGLNMMDKLEKKYSISVLSVFEEIAISPESPFFFKMRTDMLVQAEFELRVIKDRTNFGITQAKKEGRWLTRAPFGYVNKRDNQNKPILVVDPEKADVVRSVFDLFISGTPMSEIAKSIKEYTLRSNSGMTRMLTNPAYAGLIRLGKEYVKGIHEPIIDFHTFNKAQQFFKKETRIKVIYDDNVPLRGLLKCHCGRLMTAGKSKGKSSYHWYYKCKSHLDVNLNAKKLHTKLEELLVNLSLSPRQVEYLKVKAERDLRTRLKQREGSIPETKRKINDLENKLSLLEEKFILNQVNYETYSKWQFNYSEELGLLRSKLIDKDQQQWQEYKRYLPFLSELAKFYSKSSTLEKQRFLSVLFNHDLSYRLNTFEVRSLPPWLMPKAPLLKEKGLLVVNSPRDDYGKATISSGNGNIVELLNFIKELTA